MPQDRVRTRSREAAGNVEYRPADSPAWLTTIHRSDVPPALRRPAPGSPPLRVGLPLKCRKPQLHFRWARRSAWPTPLEAADNHNRRLVSADRDLRFSPAVEKAENSQVRW